MSFSFALLVIVTVASAFVVVSTRNIVHAALALGFCFKARNNWRVAQRSFEEALESLPAGETAHRKSLLYELARTHAEAGDLGKAVDLASELAHLDFAYRDIQQLLDDWQARLRPAS